MSKSLVPLSVQSPGFLGLNTQNSGSVLPVGWATKLENFVYDDIGRLASRKGTQNINSPAITGTPEVKSQHEYIDESGNKLHIIAAGNAIYKVVGTTLTDISGTITTPTADNWQFANFNGKCVGYQNGHTPIELSSAAGTFVDATGTMYNGDMVLSAYGRTWTVYANNLYYSDLLIHDYASGSSGSFDLSKYWPNGMDEAVAITDFNGFLVVFGKESIIVYADPDEPTSSMHIVEGVNGVGCIARDSVQVIGKEVAFLSSTGIRTLSRTVQEKSMPLGDISRHVRDALVTAAINEDPDNIKSVYNRDEGFYLISLPTAGYSYYFDLKFMNDDGTWKATTWDYAPSSLLYTQGLDMYIGTDDGFVCSYSRYSDGVLQDGTGGTNYTCIYEGVWNDFGEQVSALLKIPKRANVLCAGVAGGTVTLKWAFDYLDVWRQEQLTFQVITKSQYGVSKYAVDVYSGTIEFERITSPMTSAGQVIKFGIEAEVVDVQFALQRIDMMAKAGRLGL